MQHLYSIHLAEQAEDCTMQLADHIKVKQSSPLPPPTPWDGSGSPSDPSCRAHRSLQLPWQLLLLAQPWGGPRGEGRGVGPAGPLLSRSS